MSYLHELAMLAIDTDCAVLVTNMIRSAPLDEGRTRMIQREYLGSSVSIYSHFRLKFLPEIPSRGWFRAELLQPRSGTAQFAITSQGVLNRD
jgi:hypothetical protein